jgi:hypothetical protein
VLGLGALDCGGERVGIKYVAVGLRSLTEVYFMCAKYVSCLAAGFQGAWHGSAVLYSRNATIRVKGGLDFFCTTECKQNLEANPSQSHTFQTLWRGIRCGKSSVKIVLHMPMGLMDMER